MGGGGGARKVSAPHVLGPIGIVRGCCFPVLYVCID